MSDKNICQYNDKPFNEDAIRVDFRNKKTYQTCKIIKPISSEKVLVK